MMTRLALAVLTLSIMIPTTVFGNEFYDERLRDTEHRFDQLVSSRALTSNEIEIVTGFIADSKAYYALFHNPQLSLVSLLYLDDANELMDISQATASDLSQTNIRRSQLVHQ